MVQLQLMLEGYSPVLMSTSSQGTLSMDVMAMKSMTDTRMLRARTLETCIQKGVQGQGDRLLAVEYARDVSIDVATVLCSDTAVVVIIAVGCGTLSTWSFTV